MALKSLTNTKSSPNKQHRTAGHLSIIHAKDFFLLQNLPSSHLFSAKDFMDEWSKQRDAAMSNLRLLILFTSLARKCEAVNPAVLSPSTLMYSRRGVQMSVIFPYNLDFEKLGATATLFVSKLWHHRLYKCVFTACERSVKISVFVWWAWKIQSEYKKENPNWKKTGTVEELPSQVIIIFIQNNCNPNTCHSTKHYRSSQEYYKV